MRFIYFYNLSLSCLQLQNLSFFKNLSYNLITCLINIKRSGNAVIMCVFLVHLQ